jgi:demethylmenaquinone methyltransferase/2-methoxy-6-polyprenyl-1,4-benzoquinol methylase
VGNNELRHGELARVFRDIRLRPGDRVLDAGCGNGVLIRHVEERIGEAGRITAIDYAPAMVARARELYEGYDNIDFLAGEIESADLPEGSFDTVLCFAVLPHVGNQALFIARLRRLIKPDGRLYIFHLADTKTLNDFHSGLDAPVRHDLLPERAELEALLAASGFAMLRYIDRTGLNFVESSPC